ncbi:MAG: CDP-alcohol phosphatidyltransferase family protein [Desulfobacteraceae bacterium]|nr:CDP-alcohol phosphatidyltransferase family protein [Desulfobacteraceae bacterium]
MTERQLSSNSWKTKPTDRFVLRWIKCNLSARITPQLVIITWLRPWMITACSAGLGICAGVVFALGLGWLAGLVAAAAQIIDGVDGQFARLTGRESRAGAFLDSVLDRYADLALVIGLVLYLIRLQSPIPLWQLLILGSLALIGSSQISYSTSRGNELEINLGQPTLASKGTRTSVIIICALGSFIWTTAPIFALLYLAVHPNAVVMARLVRAHKTSPANIP